MKCSLHFSHYLMNTKNKLTASEGRMARLVRLWSDFQYVRHNANRPLEGVARYGNGASFQMMPSTLRLVECYDRLPKWLRKLATLTANKPNVQERQTTQPENQLAASRRRIHPLVSLLKL